MPRLAVLGHPVTHSRSPAMHNAALADLGLAPDWSYEAMEIPPGSFEERVMAMPDRGFLGANVTVPHKGAALAVASIPTETAREIGAANTLTFADGDVFADNTDAPGLLDAIGRTPSGMRALVLGAGGAARAVVWALTREGAAVEVWNRTELRSRNLCEELGGSVVADPDPAGYGLIVNATSVGLGGEDPFVELPLAEDGFGAGQIVVDMVYGEEPSRILEAAGGSGATLVDGIEILVRQGARSLARWTGMEPSLEVMREAARGVDR
jgi:shikimate dehydrogenase